MPDLNVDVRKFHNPPPEDTILWRYMDFTKFIALLERRALFFARSDKLNDPFEGSFPQKNIKARYVNLHPEFEEVLLSLPSLMSAFWMQLKRFTLVSCWHESNYESEAMWKLYASANGGLAIKTRFDSFVKSFITDEKIHIGKVQYVDYDNDLIPEDDPLSPYLHKRKSFEHEQEVRAIVQNVNTSQLTELQDDYDIGKYYEVDLNLLIQEVVVDPFTPEWFLELVDLVAQRYNLQAPINKSHLAALPMWFPPDRIDEVSPQEDE